MRRVWVAIALIVPLLAACVPQAGDQAKDVRPPAAMAGAHTGGTIRVGITPPDGIDPTGAHEPAGSLITSTMCDQLIALDPATGKPVPSLASSWTVVEGGDSVFVKLRPGVKFSDGTTMTADDVQFTLSRLANQQFAAPSASLLERVGGYGFVHGEIPARNAKQRRTLQGVQIVDSSTISVSLIEPLSDFFRSLSHPATSPVPRRAVERDPAGFAKHPVCAGPYRLADTPAPGGTVKLLRVDGYAGASRAMTRTGRGYADEIDFVPFATRQAADDAFRAGTVDVAPLPETDSRPPPSGATIVTQPTLQTEFLGLPATKPPFNDARVRRAFSLAIDRGDLASRVFAGRRPPATSIVPGALISDPEAASCGANAPEHGDVAGARALLQQAGVAPASIKTTLTYNDEYSNKRLVEWIAARLQSSLGVQVKTVPMAWTAFQAAAARPQGLDGMFRFGWAPPYPSAEQFIAPLFTVNGIGKNNWSLYSSRDLNDSLREANVASNNRDRERALRNAAATLCSDMPLIPLVTDTSAFLVRQSLGSARSSQASIVDGSIQLRELYVVTGG